MSKSIGDFTYISLTGGEPFLRDDLPQIAYTFYKNNNVQNMSISTNGFLTEKIVEVTKKILKKCSQTNVTVIISIDGLSKKHDKIRGVKGVFDKAIETVKRLKSLKKHFSNLNIGVAITMISQNQRNLSNVYEYIRDNLGPDSISITIIRGDVKDPVSKKVNIEHYERICMQLDKDLLSGRVRGYSGFLISDFIVAMKTTLWKLTSKIYRKNKYVLPCYAGLLSGVIYSNGDVYPCELLDKKMGNIKEFDYDFKKLWLSKNSKFMSHEILNKKCFCYHDCNLTCNILFNPWYVLKLTFYVGILNVNKFFNKLWNRNN